MQSSQPDFFTQPDKGIESQSKPLIKYTHPSAYDFYPYGTQWIFMDSDKKEMFIQLGDKDNPRWERMGFLLEAAFEDLFNNKQFVDECLRLFKHKEEDPLIKITEIIKNHQR